MDIHIRSRPVGSKVKTERDKRGLRRDKHGLRRDKRGLRHDKRGLRQDKSEARQDKGVMMEQLRKKFPTDYHNYSLSAPECLEYGAAGLSLAAGIAWLFYQSLTAFLILSPLVFVVPLVMRPRLRELRQQELAREFRDGAIAVSSFLSCGYSVENAFRYAEKEMATVYGEEGMITQEFRRICRGLELNCTVEEGVRNLAERSGLPEIEQFSEVFTAAKRSSGDLTTVLKDTADLLAKKIDLREEIQTMIAAKKLEQNIMSLMPAGILLYINITNPGYTDNLYGNFGGQTVMTICLGLYGFAVWWGQQILKIEV